MLHLDNLTKQRYLKNLLNGDYTACSELVNSLIENDADIHLLYTGLFQASLYEVGQLWQDNKISVANEHLATAMTETLMNFVSKHFFDRSKPTHKKAIIGCIGSESHQIGAKMVSDLLEINGWDTQFIGARVTLDKLVKIVAKNKPDILGLSLTLTKAMPQLIEAHTIIRRANPNLQIILGGMAFNAAGVTYPIDLYTQRISSLFDLETTLKKRFSHA